MLSTGAFFRCRDQGDEILFRASYRSDRFGQALRYRAPRRFGSHRIADLQWSLVQHFDARGQLFNAYLDRASLWPFK